MKIPSLITLKWLRAKRGGLVNAKRLVNQMDFYKIPTEIIGEALNIPTGDGDILLHQVCCDRSDLQKVPKQFLTAELLLSSNDYGIRPMEYAAVEGALDVIPWKTFRPSTCVRYLSLLEGCAETDAANCEVSRRGKRFPPLNTFIKNLEALVRLKQNEKFEQEG
jgi:hypothetical protein